MRRTPLPTLLLAIVLPLCSIAQKISSEDESTASSLRQLNKNDDFIALTLADEYNFDKDRNEMKQPVVTATGDRVVTFMGLRENASMQYFQSYNKFVALKKFNLYYKSGSKYSLVARSGVDRSITDDNIFFDDNRVQFYTIKFDKNGEGAKVEAEQQYSDSKYLTSIFFHTYFPVKERTIKFVVPAWLKVEFKEMNFEGYKIKKEQAVEGKNTVYTFTMTDLPAVKNESNDIGMAYTHPHIVVLTRSFEFEGAEQKGFQETADLYNWYNFLYSKCKNETAALKSQVDNIIKGKTTDVDKVKALYYWVQDNIRYIAFEDGYAGFIPDAVQNVLKNKYGDCKGMANLLTEMLRLAGFDAHFTWIGTKHIPYDHATMPAMCVDNHAICTLYLNGKTYFLDATESYVPFNENAYRIQGKSALIQKGPQFDIRYVPVSEKNANRLSTKASFVLNGRVLKGHVKITLTGNERTDFLQYYNAMPVEKQKEFLKSVLEFSNNNLTASNVITSDLDNRELPVIIEGDVDLSNNVTIAGDDIYASIDFFPKSLSRYMPDDKRQKGYDFESMFTYEDEIELTIPADKKFIDVPETVKMDYPDYAFNGEYAVNKNKITLKKSLAISSGQVKRTDFTNWISFLNKMKEFNKNQLSITKK